MPRRLCQHFRVFRAVNENLYVAVFSKAEKSFNHSGRCEIMCQKNMIYAVHYHRFSLDERLTANADSSGTDLLLSDERTLVRLCMRPEAAVFQFSEFGHFSDVSF